MFMLYDRRIDYIFYVIIALLFLVLIVKGLKKAKTNPSKYDERQIMMRGRAYQIGFMTILVLSASYIFFSLFVEELITYGYLWNCVSMIIGITVFAVYSIWNDAFFSLKEDVDSYIIQTCFIIFVNCIGISPIVQEINSIGDLLLSYRLCNVLITLSFTIVLVTLLLKKHIDRKEED